MTVLTEAVEDIESELEVMLSFDGLIGDLFRPKSSVDELSFPLILEATVLMGILCCCEELATFADTSSSWELDLTKLFPN